MESDYVPVSFAIIVNCTYLLVLSLILAKMMSYFVHVVDSPRISSSWHSIFSNCCKDHTFVKALLEPTILTSISLCLVDFTISISYAVVYAFVLHCSLKETFAPAS